MPEPTALPVRVVAALIEREGRILIAQRGPEDRWAGKWEFPGGKMEPGETPEQALARELDEELGIQATIGEMVESYLFAYPGRDPLELIFFRVRTFLGEPENRIFGALAWAEPHRLPEFDFLDGDVDFVRRLAAQRPHGGK